MKLRPFCTYQGSKRRIAAPIVDIILDHDDGTRPIYDVCCGSGAISMTLIDRNIEPSRITMIDAGLFGKVFEAIGKGTFDIERMQAIVDLIPNDPNEEKSFLLSYRENYFYNEEQLIYDFLLLQSSTYYGSPVDFSNCVWSKNGIMGYFGTTEGRHYTITPRPKILMKRIMNACDLMRQLIGIQADAMSVNYKRGSIIYIDPPYKGTAGYHFDFDPLKLIEKLPPNCSVFISEKRPLSTDAYLIATLGKRDEWLSLIQT